MYEHQERSVKTLADRVDSTIESKLQNCMFIKLLFANLLSSLLVQSQLKLTEQLHEQARIELNKQIHQRTQENTETTGHILELTTKITTSQNELNQFQMNAQSKINELTDEIVGEFFHFIREILLFYLE